MKKILIIMGAFAPRNTCGSIPNTKLTKYLARRDLEITLITSAVTQNVVTDDRLMPKEIERIRMYRVPLSRLFSKTLGLARQKATDSGLKLKMKAERRRFRAKLVSVLKTIYFHLRDKDWTHNAKRLVRRELKGETFDIVYSSYPAYEEHLLAKYVMKNHMAQKWVADFRDPMAYFVFDQYSYERDLEKQHRIEQQADFITVVSKGALDKFRFPDIPEQKLTYIPNGYDPEDFDVSASASGSPSDKLRLFYAGTLYAGQRDLTVLFRAISDLAAEGLIDPDRISLEYAGNEWPILQGFAERSDLLHICTNYGYITRHRVMELMGEIDCSLVCSNNTAQDQGIVTGKVFELLLVEKPILAVISGDLPGSELGAIIRDCSAGFVYEEANAASDYPAMKQWLLGIYREKLETGKLRSGLNRAERNQYSYAVIAQRLDGLFDELLRC